jgi:hypothetical protein
VRTNYFENVCLAFYFTPAIITNIVSNIAWIAATCKGNPITIISSIWMSIFVVTVVADVYNYKETEEITVLLVPEAEQVDM